MDDTEELVMVGGPGDYSSPPAISLVPSPKGPEVSVTDSKGLRTAEPLATESPVSKSVSLLRASETSNELSVVPAVTERIADIGSSQKAVSLSVPQQGDVMQSPQPPQCIGKAGLVPSTAPSTTSVNSAYQCPNGWSGRAPAASGSSLRSTSTKSTSQPAQQILARHVASRCIPTPSSPPLLNGPAFRPPPMETNINSTTNISSVPPPPPPPPPSSFLSFNDPWLAGRSSFPSHNALGGRGESSNTQCIPPPPPPPPVALVPMIPSIHNHISLFSPATLGVARSVLLQPFARTAYVTTCPATAVDFATYFWLLAVAQPERWYSWIDFRTLKQLQERSGFGICLQPDTIQPISSPLDAPAGLMVPRICAGAALLSPLPGGQPKCSCSSGSDCDKEKEEEVEGTYELQHDDPEDGDGVPSHTCGSTMPRKQGPPIAYYSIEQAVRSPVDCPPPPGIPAPPPRRGDSVFRVVKTSSRGAAAAAAFYDAGAHGYSTLFTCAVRDQVVFGDCIGMESGCLRVKELKSLKKKTSDLGKVRVFY